MRVLDWIIIACLAVLTANDVWNQINLWGIHKRVIKLEDAIKAILPGMGYKRFRERAEANMKANEPKPDEAKP